jgi:hypothetical protein
MTRERVGIVLAVALFSAASLHAEDAKPAQIAGKWEISREGRNGTTTSPVTFEQEGDKLKGTVAGREGREFPLTGKVEGNKVQFSFQAPSMGGPGGSGETRTVEYSGTVDGDAISGEVETPRGKRSWTAKRVASADAAKKDDAKKDETMKDESKHEKDEKK